VLAVRRVWSIKRGETIDFNNNNKIPNIVRYLIRTKLSCICKSCITPSLMNVDSSNESAIPAVTKP